MDLDNIKKAHQIFDALSEMTVEEATKQLNTYQDIDPKVKQLTLDLIENANQPSHYFDAKIGRIFNPKTNDRTQIPEGTRIGDYTLTGILGEGGMSQVYSARRMQTGIQKPVAIKVFAPINYSPELEKRFLAEQEILSALSHPNIIAMQHGGTTENCQAYFVMELIEGARSIVDYSKHHRLNTAQKIGLIHTAAKAIEYAHNNLIIHRDLKPSNIIVSNDGQLKLVDFGIAKLIPLSQQLEQHTIMVMTPDYASPEQIKQQRITVKSDVFSLAAVAVNLLTAQQPFPKDRLFKGCDQDEVYLHSLLKQDIADKDLRNVLNKALQQEPKRRYQNMYEFSGDLEFWLNKKPVSATHDSYSYRLLKFIQRRRALSASLLVLTLTFTLGLILFSWQYNQTRTEAQKAQAVKQFMLDAFSVTDPNVSEGVDISAQDILKIATEKLTDNKDIDGYTQFELYQSLGLAYGKLGVLPKALELLKKSLEIKPHDSHSLSFLCQYLFNSTQQEELSHWLNQIDETQFSSLEDRARVSRVRANRLAYEGDYEAAFHWLNTLKGLNVTSQSQLANQRLEAEVYYLMGESDQSIKIIKQAIKATHLKPTNTFVLGMKSDLIHYYDRVGNIDDALALSLQVVAIYRKILGNKHPDLGVVLNELSVFYRLKGEFEKSKTMAEESRDLFYALYGEYSEGLSQAYSNLGMLNYLDGHQEAAIKQFIQAAEILRHVYSSEHPETLIAEANLATIMTGSGHAKEAQKLLSHVYQVESKTLGKHHRSTLFSQQSLALALATTGDFKKALNHAKENVELSGEFFDAKLPLVISSQFMYGRVLLLAGKYQKALTQLLPLETEFRGNPDFDSFKLNGYLAQIYTTLGQPKKAEAYYKKTIAELTAVYSSRHIKTLETRLEYAQFLKSQQRTDEADKVVRDIESVIKQNNVSAADLTAELAQF